ncbi:uncharacterized protein LOC121325139 [Polyodon spathula]|uniref:uncharacterized protein LOC121325139 n=1 Tax=Polyodon spathula TaxID=7913 RepID=UPI001B7F2AA1|nr:uncharacterized protein LOC121325139 [Polyodon spathula]
MSSYYTHAGPQHYHPGAFMSTNPYWHWRPARATGHHPHFLPPIYSSRPLTLVLNDWGANQEGGQVEYHHFYGFNPFSAMNPHLYSQRPCVYPPVYQGYGSSMPEPQSSGAWPEGFTLKGELRWGKLERINGARKEVPEFVKDDLRRVYGTYPKTEVSITYRGGEYLVKGDPWVGEQEYKLEKKVIRQPSSHDGDSVSEIVEMKKKKKKSKR